ncbi:glycosyltransferase family 71 protein [Phlyctema vagabunda]|uniref:Glycosyltransferase family 71 protein n=1 Tax=Phlyctema vagabunda TaxID=108571 RepID=A0ABR4PZ30_9HELO
MRSQTRLIAATVTFLLITLSLFQWKAVEIPNYLPQKAHDYFHPDLYIGENPQTSHEPLKAADQPGTSAEEETELDRLLDEFTKRPVLTYEQSFEANSKTCPTEGVNFDVNAVNGNAENWPNITSSQISDWRHGIVAHLRQRQIEQREKTKSESFFVGDKPGNGNQRGRGIVMAVGDRAAAIRARTNIRLLQSYNCTLPVEIFHFSTELTESDKNLLEELSQSNFPAGSQERSEGMKVSIKTVEKMERGNDWKAFQIKGAAMQQSSFDEILYLDTDSYLVRNPNYLFEGKEWKATGLLLWPDYTKSHASNPLWRLLGQRCRNEYEGESGQILISRTHHQDLLWLVEYFALNHNDYYGFMGGDRDSFRAAALLLGKRWAGPGRLNAAAGVVMPNNPQGDGHTMLQADPEGRWTFVHANLIKHARFNRPLWAQIHRAAKDKYEAGTTYGSIEAPNDKIGEGVMLQVASTPRMVSSMSSFEGYDQSLVAVEDWDTYEELKGFEEKWFGFGAVH